MVLLIFRLGKFSRTNHVELCIQLSSEKDQSFKLLSHSARYKSRRDKRLNVNEYAYCKDGVATMSSVMTQCYGKPSDHYELKCKVNPSKTCIYKVSCSLTDQGWDCPGVHQFNHIVCCYLSCKI